MAGLDGTLLPSQRSQPEVKVSKCEVDLGSISDTLSLRKLRDGSAAQRQSACLARERPWVPSQYSKNGKEEERNQEEEGDKNRKRKRRKERKRRKKNKRRERKERKRKEGWL